MEWFAPITILPGIGLLILSTSNFTIALNTEITELCLNVEKNKEIIDLKIIQLKRLSFAISFLYASVIAFLLSGLLKGIELVGNRFFVYLMILGTFFVSIAVIILFVYSIKAISIRQKHLKH